MADAVRLQRDEGETVPEGRSGPGRFGPRSAVRLLATVSGTASLPQEEVRALLHQRLIVVASAVAPVYGLIVVVLLSGVDPAFSLKNLGWGVVTLSGLLTVSTFGCLGWLLARRTERAGVLRGVELAIFGMLAASLAAARSAAFFRGPAEEFGGAAFGRYYLQWIAALNGIGWMATIIGYGVLIPNTRGRAAAMVLGLAAVPLLADAALVLRHPRLADHLGFVEVITAIALVPSVPIALFGSFRLAALEGEAAAARREVRALNQYQLTRRLGTGGMGEVYLAEHRLLKRPCAVKLIRPDRAGDAQAILRFRREVQATARLTHMNTVEVYDFGQAEDGTFYYVMEYLPGLSLDELAQRDGPLPPARVVHWLRQVCGALREAHGVGLVHRDIKPSNVIVCPYAGLFDVAKLLDFGLVHLTAADTDGAGDGRITVDGGIVGTPEYMSPEQAHGDPLDGRSDLYSLGALAYYLLTGRPPFVGRTAMDTLFAHCNEPPLAPGARRRDLPADLDAVILRCLAKDVNARFQDAEGLDAALAQCLCAGADAWTQAQAAACWHDLNPPFATDAPSAWAPTETYHPDDHP